MIDINVLNVNLHDKTIGTITLLPGDRSIFAFNNEYIEDAERDTLSLYFKNPYGELITEFKTTGPTLLPFFFNLLPEGALRNYLAARAGVKPVREFYLLWVLGNDLPGAVTVTLADEHAWPLSSGDTEEELEKRKQKAMRFSLAGVQLKFSALRNEGKKGGLTIPAKGVGGSWIVKLPADRFDAVPENEFSFMTLASRIGIDVPAIQLIDLDDILGLPEGLGHLRGDKAAIKRFDRTGEGANHIEDFALLPDNKFGKKSYRNIAAVLGIETGDADIIEFIRRLVFSTLIGNDDMHLKNWSLIYYDRRNASLAPAYDLLSTIPYLPSETAALTYVRTNKMTKLNLDELAYLADKAKLPEKVVLDTAKQTVSDFLEVWAREKTNLYLASDVINTVDEHIGKLAIVDEA